MVQQYTLKTNEYTSRNEFWFKLKELKGNTNEKRTTKKNTDQRNEKRYGGK